MKLRRECAVVHVHEPTCIVLMLMLVSVRPQLRLFKSLASSAQRMDGSREKTRKTDGI